MFYSGKQGIHWWTDKHVWVRYRTSKTTGEPYEQRPMDAYSVMAPTASTPTTKKKDQMPSPSPGKRDTVPRRISEANIDMIFFQRIVSRRLLNVDQSRSVFM